MKASRNWLINKNVIDNVQLDSGRLKVSLTGRLTLRINCVIRKIGSLRNRYYNNQGDDKQINEQVVRMFLERKWFTDFEMFDIRLLKLSLFSWFTQILRFRSNYYIIITSLVC